MKAKNILALVALVAVSFGMLTYVNAASEPAAPSTFSEVSESTFDPSDYSDQTHEAYAGNITELTLAAVVQTKAWQGYFGNISATITLDDANENTFYNWSEAEPRGQVYATLGNTVTWTSVECYNFTDTRAGGLNETDIEDYFNIAVDHADGVAETYNETNHNSFVVVSRTMTGCPTTYVYQSDDYQQSNFQNVLLHDFTDNTTGWIYTTLIENKAATSSADLACYHGGTCDFQILVNEDGHGTNVATTTYYFWVELA